MDKVRVIKLYLPSFHVGLQGKDENKGYCFALTSRPKKKYGVCYKITEDDIEHFNNAEKDSSSYILGIALSKLKLKKDKETFISIVDKMRAKPKIYFYNDYTVPKYDKDKYLINILVSIIEQNKL